MRTLTEEQAVKQIVQTVERATPGEAPFALVLGAGFSFGLVPTVKQLITRHLPLWAQVNGDVTAYRKRLEQVEDPELEQVAAQFWRNFVQANEGRQLGLKLTQAGLPEANRFADAYKAVFSADFDSVIGAPADARKFQRALMQLDRPRMNAAHFLLASLLGAQSSRFKSSDQFRFASAFSRLILTTNFDPFLQLALQSVNRLYYMSDTPDLGVSDEIFDDHTDAIHLVYLHGSVHRRAQAATDEEIRAIKDKNAQTLSPVLKRRGVIVLGYSGWDDAIVEALSRCEDFDYRLYWCGRAADPLSPGAFGPRVPEILRKRSACYVLTSGAARFMQLISNGLVRGLPRLLDDPAAHVRGLLESIDFSELADLKEAEERKLVEAQGSIIDLTDRVSPAGYAQPSSPHPLEAARARAISVLTSISSTFRPSGAECSSTVSELPVGEEVDRLIESAQLAIGLGAHSEAVSYCSEALRGDVTDVNKLATLWHLKAQAHFGLRQFDEAIEQWGAIIELPGVAWQRVANALMHRGKVYSIRERLQQALVDFSQIIERTPRNEVAGHANEILAAALINRAATFAQLKNHEAELSDYHRVIEDLPGVCGSTLAAALFHRAHALSRLGRFEEAIRDFSLVIKMPDTDGEYRRRAAVERGFASAELHRRGGGGGSGQAVA